MAEPEIQPHEFIRAKRDRQRLSAAGLTAFVTGMATGAVSESQIGAFAMAVFLNGMSREEVVALTLAMRDSGAVLDWSDLPGPVCDKHSTGGVGDNVSLIVAPIVAACGVYVPMVAGRGLGHTGGTIDKMESIPGYVVEPARERFCRAVRETGCAIVGRSADLAPASGRLRAVRGATATLESVPLITASILSGKLAEGLDSLVLDVKVGNGAFMEKSREAAELATSLVETANGAGLAATALLTDMGQPLAPAVGNALEVASAVDFLTGRLRERRLEEVVMALAAEMLLSCGRAGTHQQAATLAAEALGSGSAAAVFERMVAALGGPADFVEKADRHLVPAPVERAVRAPHGGYVREIATRELGLAAVGLGGGRRAPGDRIDPAAGLSRLLPVGAEVAAGDALALVHARDEAAAERAVAAVAAAYGLGERRPSARKTILRRIAAP